MTTFDTRHRTTSINGLEVYFREAGNPRNPALLLLHGFPTSSHMFRNLIAALSDEYYLVAPDYIGFGNSAAPSVDEFRYSFDNLTEIVEGLVDKLGLQRFALYIQDYGAPIGLRIASRTPERVTALITQSGNAYLEGFTPFWDILFAHAKDREANAAGVRELFENCCSPSPSGGSTRTASRPTGWPGSRRKRGNSTRRSWTGRATTRCSYNCSGTTSSISTATRPTSSTSAPTSLRLW